MLADDAVGGGHVFVEVADFKLEVFVEVPTERAVGAVLVERVVAAVRSKVDEELVVDEV